VGIGETYILKDARSRSAKTGALLKGLSVDRFRKLLERQSVECWEVDTQLWGQDAVLFTFKTKEAPCQR